LQAGSGDVSAVCLLPLPAAVGMDILIPSQELMERGRRRLRHSGSGRTVLDVTILSSAGVLKRSAKHFSFCERL